MTKDIKASAGSVALAGCRPESPPSWCCQRCGENIGWLGRGMEWLLWRMHDCTFWTPPETPENWLAQQIYDADAWRTGNIISWQEQGGQAQDFFRSLARDCLAKATPTPPVGSSA